MPPPGSLIMELGAGSDDDLLEALDRLLPRDDRWRHRHGTPGHGADHVLPLLVSASVSVPVIGGRMALGTWQSIALLDPNRDNAPAHGAPLVSPRLAGSGRRGGQAPTCSATRAGSAVGSSHA